MPIGDRRRSVPAAGYTLVDEKAKAAPEPPKRDERLGVTRTRWWILIVYSALSFGQGLTYNLYGPIAEVVKDLVSACSRCSSPPSRLTYRRPAAPRSTTGTTIRLNS